MADIDYAVFSQQDRAAVIRRGFGLEWLSAIWMTIEAIVAVQRRYGSGQPDANRFRSR